MSESQSLTLLPSMSQMRRADESEVKLMVVGQKAYHFKVTWKNPSGVPYDNDVSFYIGEPLPEAVKCSCKWCSVKKEDSKLCSNRLAILKFLEGHFLYGEIWGEMKKKTGYEGET